MSKPLNQSMQVVIINKIKAHSLNDRLFRKLCEENSDEYKRPLLHTEVQWLSKGNSFQQFYEVYYWVFWISEDIEKQDLATELKKIKQNVAYLSDLFEKFNTVNLKVQGKKMTLIKTKSVISAFTEKLLLFKNNLARREFINFQSWLKFRKPKKLLMNIF